MDDRFLCEFLVLVYVALVFTLFLDLGNILSILCFEYSRQTEINQK